MKFLIIVDTIGRTAAGLVFERLIKELHNKNAEINAICRENKSHLPDKIPVYEIPLRLKKETRFKKLIFTLIRFEYNCYIWERLAIKKIKKNHIHFEKILALVSNYNSNVLNTAYIISKKFNCSYHIHAIDTIPPPECWGENKYFRNARKRYVLKAFRNAASLSMINPQMLDYQKKTMNINDIPSKVIYNPVYEQMILRTEEYNGEKYLLYAGELNIRRHPEKLIKAMNILEEYLPDLKLYFLGTEKNMVLQYCPENKFPGNIKVLQWTEHPEDYMKNAMALVDIDIDKEEDVFISGKLMTYLNSNIPILSITTKNSPSMKLLGNLKHGIFIVNHDIMQIVYAVRKIYTYNGFKHIKSERENFIADYKADFLIQNLLKLVESC